MKLYVGGIASEMNWDWDVDLMSYMEIEKMIKNEGYCNIRCLWYWNPKFAFSRGLRPLNDDKDVLRFMEDIRGYKLIDIYVEHKVEKVNIEDVRFDDANGEDENLEEENGEDENVEDANGEDENVEEANGEDENVEGVNSEDSETDPDYNMSNEEHEGDEDDEDDEGSEDDELNLGHDVGVDWTIVLPNTSTEKPLEVNSDTECGDSDDLHTPLGSDVEDGMERFPAFKQSTKFEIGMMFKDKMQIKDAVKE
ncbi:protein bfr2-like [Vicia villosa]|uniref:protein bfr2-like n=1 Tax=Vicia villosa TaxID=3911 RepID=UPI00273CDCA8|nr:protein bfr2-like [Vicia villosa]